MQENVVQETAVQETAARAENGEEMVKIRLFKDNGRYKDPVFVGVNGRNWMVQRGVDVEVPACVAEVLDHSATQDGLAADFVMKMEAAAQQN